VGNPPEVTSDENSYAEIDTLTGLTSGNMEGILEAFGGNVFLATFVSSSAPLPFSI